MHNRATAFTVRLRNPLSSLERCPQCGTAKPTLELHNVVWKRMLIERQGQWSAWLIYQCTSCTDIVTFGAILPKFELSQLKLQLSGSDVKSISIMPGFQNETLNDWPSTAANFMRQALNTRAAPDGAVMLTGSAVDAMLKEKGLTKGSVYDRINNAVAEGLLTEAMGEWAHSVRLAANNPRHADLNSPHATLDQADASIEFAQALGQFLFVLPAKVRRGKEAAQTTLEKTDASG